ncbi:MAG TPA: hypothetical protein VGC13_31660 [Longimicrobium sp.]|jgi:hypothetical protein|uniref:hypothetical protein n=1 Tax=Longimicrobium sp. TaxID=2029185 RepID=UPI002ED83E4D
MRGLRRRLRFLAIATVIVGAGQCVTGGTTYRPSVHPLGWNARGELLFIHQEETGGYDWREYACGGSGVYALRRGNPRPALTGRAWCGTAGGVAHTTFTLSSDARRLFAVPQYDRGDCGNLRALDLERGRWSQLYRTCVTNLAEVAVSPDGRAFVGYRTCSKRWGGGEPPQVRPPGCVAPPDGRMRLFAASGSGERPIGRPGHRDPVWSPDGRALLLRGQADTIVHLELATGAERVVAHGSDPAWSADGRWIAFIGDDHASRRPRVSLRIIRVNGGGERTVFAHAYGRTWNLETRANGIPESPLWSPDGRRIVFARTTTVAIHSGW